LIHGAPNMRAMTTCNDAAVNNLVKNVELMSGAPVRVLREIVQVERLNEPGSCAGLDSCIWSRHD